MLVAVLVLVAALGAAHVLARRRYPTPAVTPQEPIGPMTPTFQQRLLGTPGLRAVDGSAVDPDPEPATLRPAF